MNRLFSGLVLLSLTTFVYADCPSWLDHEIGKLHSSQTLNLCELTQDKAVLLVNTASHCGFTHQFKDLETLHQKYSASGLVVVGFPSHSFNQESKDAAKTAAVCYKNYGVTFAMTEAIDVTGESAHAIFKHLADKAGAPRWNFTKYLIDPSGEKIERFQTQVNPSDTILISAVESVL